MKISVFIGLSLDGYIARPDGDIEWLNEAEPPPNGDDAGYGAFFESVDVLLMGRGSFEKVQGFTPWPYESKPVVVLSNSLTEIPEALQDKVRLEKGAPDRIVEKMAQAGYRHIYLDGGKVIQSFLRAGLVDEMILTTIPILIGEGIPLFGHLEKDIKLRLIENKSWSNGFVQSRYLIAK